MIIERAKISELSEINELLNQVLDIHHNGRPDIFKGNTKKYTDEELLEIINDDTRPIFVALLDGHVVGYAFCIFKQCLDNNIFTDIKTLYIDDFCVKEGFRGHHIGTELYNYVVDFAKENGFYNVTLNVWAFNEDAKAFYESLGMKPQKFGMETII